jgi:hypothetical protein
LKAVTSRKRRAKSQQGAQAIWQKEESKIAERGGRKRRAKLQKEESKMGILPVPLAAALLPRTSEAARAVDVEVFRNIRTQRIK